MTVYDAIVRLGEMNPGAVLGESAHTGGTSGWYDRMRQMGDEFQICTCGRDLKGWKSPELSARVDGKSWTIGYDAKSNKISCGPKGYHSDRYANDQPCWERR